MTTQYTLTDSLPKDAGGQQLLALIDTTTSQADFALLKGIGASQGNASKIQAHVGIATHTQGSPIEPLHPLVVVGGTYIEDLGASTPASPVTSGCAQLVAMSNWNEIFSRGAPLNASQVSTSANKIKASSGILMSFHVAINGGSVGDTVRLRDSTADIITFAAASGHETWSANIPTGGFRFTTSLDHIQSITDGAASVTVSFR